MKLKKIQSVYVMRNTDIGIIKIGISENPAIRLSSIKCSSGCDIKLVYYTTPIINALQIESKAHYYFSDHRRNGEWFNITEEEAVIYIQSLRHLFNTDPILDKYNNGLPISTIAAQYKVSRQAIIKRVNKYREYGLITKGTVKKEEKEICTTQDTSIITNMNNYERIGANKYKDNKGSIVIIKYINGNFHLFDK